MASFVANHRKKKEQLQKKEEELLRLIRRQAERGKLLLAALEIRDARIRVLRAKQNQNPERNPKERSIFLQDQAKIDALRQVTAESVLAEYLGNC
jgi:hypothetical protein